MEYKKINQQAWDKRTKTHVTSQFYDVEGFLDGKTSLKEIEIGEVGDVTGKSLLHLQCHFGLDTLSWARRGAKVTGVDLSPVAIQQANLLKRKTNLDANFICADVFDFGDYNEDQFDVVYTSYGTTCWLPDLDKWAHTIAKSLKTGGRFHYVDFHPIHTLLSGYSYFHTDEPDVEEEGTYTENCDGEESTVVCWSHSLADTINALIGVNIKIEQVNEYPYSPYECFQGLEEKESGRFYLSQKEQLVPMVFSIRGSKAF